MEKPLKYFNNNVYGMQILLEVMQEHDVKHIVFSSTAATYGEPKKVPITEDMETCPTNTYGEYAFKVLTVMNGNLKIKSGNGTVNNPYILK